jgi:hypothetical protein
MPQFGLSLENKKRFILSTGFAFGLVAGVGWLAYMSITGQWIPWPMVPVMLGMWLLGGIVWAWIMHAYMLRHRRHTRAFYSRLKDEMASGHVHEAGEGQIGDGQEISVVLSGYTYWENVKLAILTIYSSPLRSLSSIAFLLLMSTLILVALHSNALWSFRSRVEVIGRLLELGVIFTVGSFLFGSFVAFAQQAAQRRIFKRLGPTRLTFSADGVAIKTEAASSSTLSWSSINRAREIAGFILLIRRGRFIVGLPKRLLNPIELQTLRRLLVSVSGAIRG